MFQMNCMLNTREKICQFIIFCVIDDKRFITFERCVLIAEGMRRFITCFKLLRISIVSCHFSCIESFFELRRRLFTQNYYYSLFNRS